MATVTSIQRLSVDNDTACVTFSNGYQLLVRLVDECDSASIILTPSGKLVRINADKSCKVLAEGVSIR